MDKLATKSVFLPCQSLCIRMFLRGVVLLFLIFSPVRVQAVITESDLLLLVNDNSPTSKYVATLYRQYHPNIADNQIVHLSGLQDCSGPDSTAADEIITRDNFNTYIANPVRQYLISHNMVNSIKCIVTTAGLPYRIKDTVKSNLILPGVSGTYDQNPLPINAASVESELSVLFQIDPASPKPLSLINRAVNPYQGYSSTFDLFPRNILANRSNMNWTYPQNIGTAKAPFMDGTPVGHGGMKSRHFSPGDMYLTCRLDGPKVQGESAAFAVHDMLERAGRASSPDYGISPAQAVAIFDDAVTSTDPNSNRVFNLDSTVSYLIYNPNSLPQPPNTANVSAHDDYSTGFFRLTGYTASSGTFNSRTMTAGHGIQVIDDTRAGHRTNQADLASDKAAVALTGYGVNGDEPRSSTYLLDGGPSGTALVNIAYGAVFTSMESFNATTLFSDVPNSSSSPQGKIIDFITIGGAGAIGHSFEPVSDAAIDNEFLFYNLLADSDNDGYADMTFVEAAFSALPYLSWSEVVIGDPLMRIAYGSGGISHQRFPGDIDGDDYISYFDLWLVSTMLGGIMGENDLYNDLADLDHDGYISYFDLWLTSTGLGTSYGSP
jgi:hypothetical protein